MKSGKIGLSADSSPKTKAKTDIIKVNSIIPNPIQLEFPIIMNTTFNVIIQIVIDTDPIQSKWEFFYIYLYSWNIGKTHNETIVGITGKHKIIFHPSQSMTRGPNIGQMNDTIYLMTIVFLIHDSDSSGIE